ncbi:hypothetical protein Tco_0267587 [Tanacetum coccineum]
MSTSKTYQQSLADAGSEDRPPMLERGSYIPWASRFRRYLNRKRDNRKWLLKALDEGPYEFKEFVPEGSTIPRLQTAKDLEGDGLYCSLLMKMEVQVICETSERWMWGSIQNEVDSVTCFTNEFDQFVVEPGEALQFEKLVNASRAKKLENSHDPLALVAHTGSSSRKISSYLVNIQSKNSGNTGRNGKRAYVQEEVVEGMNALKETGNVQRTLRIQSEGILLNYLEAKLKKNVDLILKLGNSLQGMFMLGPKPLSVYDQQLKHGLGYPNPYTLKQAISKCPKLYVASSLGNLEIPLNVRDSEDTLEDAFKSQQKMTEKMNDPIVVANKQNCWTINYKKLNALYKDFVPQKELSVEQKYFPSSSIPSVKISVSKNMPNKILNAELEKVKKKSFEIQEGLQARIKILEKDVQRCEKQSLGHNLFSVGQFCDGDLEVAFSSYYMFNTKIWKACDFATGFRIYNRRTKMIMETIHVKFDELTVMASEHDYLEPELQQFNNHNSSEEQMNTPSKEDLDNLFGPMFKNILSRSLSDTPIYSAAQRLKFMKGSHYTSSIIVDTHEAPPVVTTSDE